MCYRAGVAIERVYTRPGLGVPDLEGAVGRAGDYHLWRRVARLILKLVLKITFERTAI